MSSLPASDLDCDPLCDTVDMAEEDVERASAVVREPHVDDKTEPMKMQAFIANNPAVRRPFSRIGSFSLRAAIAADPALVKHYELLARLVYPHITLTDDSTPR